MVKNLPAMREMQELTGLIPGLGRCPGVGNGNSLQYSYWKIPYIEEPGKFQPMGSQRVRHDW